MRESDKEREKALKKGEKGKQREENVKVNG
jgi:hypothetical protein